MKFDFHLVFLGIFCLVILLPIKAQNQKTASNPCIESMSSMQRDLLPNIEEGKMIFNTSSGCLNYYQDKRWRIFCEEKEKKEENIVFDQETGKLKYMINGQWYEFAFVGDYSLNQTESIVESNEISEEEKSNLPLDCQTKPTRPYAGRDLVGFDIVELEANYPSHGKGFWEIIQGDSGEFVDSNVPHTSFSGTQGTTYLLRWNIATTCDSLFDEVLVRIRPPCDPEPSQSFAGMDQLNVEEVNLMANNPKHGKGNWIVLSGLGGGFEDPSNPRTRFTGSPGQTYVLRWMIRNECGLTQDDIIIKIKPPCSPVPNMADAGNDQKNIEECLLTASSPGKGKGKWSIVEGGKGRFERSDSSRTRFFGKAGKTYTLRWTITTKCGSNMDEIEISFAASCPEEIVDTRDGMKYHAKRFAGQCWMTENLNYKPSDMESYCYEDLTGYCNEYGRLYPWKTAMNNESKKESQGLCPKGWHIPSDDEWQHLIDSSGFEFSELLKWGDAGFDVVMGGSRYTNGKFFNRTDYAYFWSSTSKSENTAWNRYFPDKGSLPDHYATDMRHSFSLRCVKDD